MKQWFVLVALVMWLVPGFAGAKEGEGKAEVSFEKVKARKVQDLKALLACVEGAQSKEAMKNCREQISKKHEMQEKRQKLQKIQEQKRKLEEQEKKIQSTLPDK
ncbi:MAG: hypothetical protein HQL90_06275 [Magnetococcales bacterium]|nr:hypothetical protein [Magnetococcales bacterium]